MLGDLWNTITDWMGSTFSSILESILHATIFRVFYWIEKTLCWIISLLYDMFEVFAGLVKVKYDGTPKYLINIFFSNKAVTNIYWAMALIGVILTFGFAIAAVVKKTFDSSGKVQQSLGQIIWSGIRSILIIFGMTAIMSFVLNGTGILMQQINYIFQDPYNLNLPMKRSFTGEEYAAMARVFCTIGNYSKVESKNNRYNLNLCFNDIRKDMYYLQQQGVFEQSYYELDKNDNQVESWQSVLMQIALSTDLDRDVTVDEYHDALARSLEHAMDYLKDNANPRPVPEISRKGFKDTDAHLDRLVFLMGTFRAARTSAYNEKPSFDDPIRRQYYYNEGKSIYNFKDVDGDFDIGFSTDYIVVWVAAIAIIFDLVVIILNCVARIFNMLFLYLIAPPVIAAQPLDNGGKTKQWMTAFLVQSLSVFGTIIAMRLLLVFLPLIVSPQLVLFDNALLNGLAKLVLIYGGFEAAKKSSSILTGILADSAGWQAVQAGDMSSSASKVMGAAKAVGGKALGVASFAAKPITNTVSRPFKSLAKHYAGLGTGKATTESGKIKEQVEHEAKLEKARQQYKKEHGGSFGGSGGGSGGSGGSGGGSGSGGSISSGKLSPAPAPAHTPGGGSGGSGGGGQGGEANPQNGPGNRPAEAPPHIPNQPQNLNNVRP